MKTYYVNVLTIDKADFIVKTPNKPLFIQTWHHRKITYDDILMHDLNQLSLTPIILKKGT